MATDKLFTIFGMYFLNLSRFSCSIKSIENVLNCQINFQTLKSSEFGQNVHELLKKYKNSELVYLYIQNLFFTSHNSFADVFCIVFHEQNFVKKKISDGIKDFSFSIEGAL